MSFFSISDPIERERVVRDYERIKREIRERNENRKMMGQNQNRLLQETFHPVVNPISGDVYHVRWSGGGG